MKISVFGCGYVGLTTAACLAELGHDVLGVDIDGERVKELSAGHVPFFEPGLGDLVGRLVQDGRLRFSGDVRRGMTESEIIICAVATPNGPRDEADLSSVLQVAESFALFAGSSTGSTGKIFLNKSTVPVGTCERIIETILQKQPSALPFTFVYNPEFLREGSALADFRKPERVIFGIFSTEVQPHTPADALKKLLAQDLFRLGDEVPAVFTSFRNAEIIKFGSNAFLATRLSFVNELAEFCETTGGDIYEVVKGMGYDPRIGHSYMAPGAGFGGSCLPKDLQAFIAVGLKNGQNLRLLSAVQEVNKRQPERLLELLCQELLYQKLPGKGLSDLRGKRIAVWGLAFKANTDDLRDAPSIVIVRELLKAGAEVVVFDPAALLSFQKIFRDEVLYGEDPYSILQDADALLVLTDWAEFRDADFGRMKELLRQPIIVDTRNIFDYEEARKHGFRIRLVGRG